MELLLQQDRKFCSACRTRRLFRISRYGCGYACLCSFLGIATVVRDFVSLRGDVLAYSDISWLPMISSSSSFGTSCISVVSVELDCCQGELHVTANNLDSCSLQDVLEALPDVLRSQSRLDTTAFRLPSGLLDELMDSLGSFCAARPGHVFLNGPFPEAIKAWDNKTAPASDDKILQAIPLVLYQTLWMHQLCAIKEVIGFGGRALIADDMGVGKTMEALGAISILRCYPLLIVCPSALKYMWADHIEKYLHGQVSIDDMHIIAGSNDAMSHDASPKVVIISYHMVSALADDLRRREWSGLLCDESHILHTNVNGTDAVYTRILLDIGKQATNCLLLSGTPALSSPFDMFNQIEMLTRGSVIGKSPWEMALRYTHIHFTPYVKVMECVRPIELNSLLRQTCMVRRLKSEVLELPGKRRVVLRIAGGASEDESASFQSRYANLWKHRIEGILEAVDLMSEKYPCFVLFAHHQLLLDRLEVHVQQRKLTYIRIDGTTCPKSRGKILADFTAKKSRVALIGITACAVGISLAAASCAVFCELPPDAGWMRQAEDRLHRVGQPNSVVVYYLLAVYSATEGRHFSRLLSAVSDVDNVLDGPTKSSISFHYSAHRTNPSGSRPAALGMAATMHHCFPSHTYHVAVSKHTGRIHVKEEGGNYYESFSLDEAYESVRLRQSPCWRELETSLVEWEQLSPFQRRQLIAAGTWRTIKSPWAACATQITGTCTSRYPSSIAIGWGCWYVVRRARGPPTYYFGPFALKGVPLCLHCHVAMGRTDIEVVPGRLRPLNSDTVMFCCGKCREQYFVQRSSSSIRRSLEAVDGGICSNCHVDCQQLCRLTMALTSIKERMLLVKRVHPQLVEFPVLCRNFVRHPTSGNCWHADHVVPVAQGGGGATIDNLQTLCVACHAVKTREDVVAITTARHSRRRTEDATPTKEFISSADRAVASLLGVVGGAFRVTSATPTILQMTRIVEISLS